MTYLMLIQTVLILTANLMDAESSISLPSEHDDSVMKGDVAKPGNFTASGDVIEPSDVTEPSDRNVSGIAEDSNIFPFFGLKMTCTDQMCSNLDRYTDMPMCYCDRECTLFGDCCADWYPRQFSNNESKMLEVMEDPEQWYNRAVDHTDYFDVVTYFTRNSECLKIKNNTNYVYVAFRVISKCPGIYESDDKSRKCEAGVLHPFHNIPVSLNTSISPIQVVFKNRFCALCHGYQEQELMLWNVTAKCPINTRISDSCTFTMIPPNVGSLRYCLMIDGRSVERCVHSGQESSGTVGTICKSYTAPIYSLESNILYANPHCGVCSVGYIFPSYCERFKEATPDTEGSGLNVLFRFSSHTSSWNAQDHEYCQEAQTWYPDKGGCYPLICPRNNKPSYGQCVEDEFAVYNHTNNMPLYQYEEMHCNISILLFFESDTRNDSAIRMYLESFRKHLVMSQIDILTDFELTTAPTSPASRVYRMVVNSQPEGQLTTVIEVTVYVINNCTVDDIYVYARVRNFLDVDLLRCKDGNVTSVNDSWFTWLETNIWHIRPHFTQIDIKVENTRYDLLINGASNIPVFKYIGICKENVYLQCPLLSYTPNEYEIKNSKVYLNTREGYVRHFQIENSILYVCNNVTTLMNVDVNIDDGTMQFVTIATLSLSLLSLCVLLVIHCAIPSLQNLHGKNLMSFSFSLFIAQCLFLMGSYVQGPVCVVTGAVQHYFWLCTFMWNSVMAFDVVGKFSAANMMKINYTNTNSRYRKYFVFAFGLPLLVVCGCVVLDNVRVGEVSVEYGSGGGYCWMGNFTASLVAFTIPVGISLLFNIVCFLLSLHGIQWAKHISKNARSKKQDTNYCIVYTKISLLLGGTWVVGFVSAAFNYAPLMYINTCLNGLQGFFIFLGFAMNARIIDLIRGKTRKASLTVIQLTDISHVSDSYASPTQ